MNIGIISINIAEAQFVPTNGSAYIGINFKNQLIIPMQMGGIIQLNREGETPDARYVDGNPFTHKNHSC